MGDEHRVVVVEIRAVAHAGTGDMRIRAVPDDIHHHFIARQHAVHGKREALEQAFLADTGKDMRVHPALMIAALNANVVKARAIGDIDLQHTVQTPRRCTALKQRKIGAFIHLYAMVKNNVFIL